MSRILAIAGIMVVTMALGYDAADIGDLLSGGTIVHDDADVLALQAGATHATTPGHPLPGGPVKERILVDQDSPSIIDAVQGAPDAPLPCFVSTRQATPESFRPSGPLHLVLRTLLI